jgi:uncharacterized peroxidase-related enzyme
MAIRSATENSRLSITERHAAALVVSALNGSHHHVAFLSGQLQERGAPVWLVDNLCRAPWWAATDDDRLDVIAMFAARLTQAPQSVAAVDVDRLRSVGLTDGEIHELVNVVSYYNCLNRLSSGLGLR